MKAFCPNCSRVQEVNFKPYTGTKAGDLNCDVCDFTITIVEDYCADERRTMDLETTGHLLVLELGAQLCGDGTEESAKEAIAQWRKLFR